ncbi:HlyD family efflux transporter periplasmic adaptor subunit [Sphingosinicella soli]|uniref:Multidrug resistance efflux pump n=1 Tax=Sphingosinicella soli TaxID=333708 RepID=A0A7W7F707_9SPHN|nr:HlyD family secretion protein [Sphingosinicella soli]MBB4632916.1 multidrug resistance efflux pump [Sphingosinicella soli]
MKINAQSFLRARSTRLVLAASLIAISAIGFAPYVFNNVSTQAAINAPLIRLAAPVDGTVAELPADGRYFARPASIRLLDLSQDTGEVADLAAQADLAQAQMDLASRQLAELRAEEHRLDKRASAFSSATRERLGEDRGAAIADLRGCHAERLQQASALTRVRRLASDGFMSPAAVEKAEAAATRTSSECSSAAAKLRSIEVTEEAARSGVFIGDSYNDAPYATQQADRLMLQRQSIEKTLSDATAQHTRAKLRLKDALGRASYRAPAGTLVWAATASSGASVRAGEPILDLVDCRRRFVQVALPERKAEAVVPGGAADVRLIGSDRWMKGRISSISGAASRREERLLAASTYSRPGAREIIVDVALSVSSTDTLDSSRRCDVGRLAEVRFSRTL